MSDYKHLVHHDSDGHRIFYKPQTIWQKAWDWFWCACLLVVIYLFLVYVSF